MAIWVPACRRLYQRFYNKNGVAFAITNFSTFLRRTNGCIRTPRLPTRNRVAFYYVKPKQKKGPSAKGWLMFVGGMLGVGVGAIVYIGLPDTDSGKDPYQNEPAPLQYIYRARDRIWDFYEMFAEPSSKMLLPDPLQEPYYQPPYTLVLEMTNVLVHPEYDRKSGWRFRKRPGLDLFLSQLGPPLFEVVVYTHEVGFSASPVIDGLDPNGMIMYRLFRDATKYIDGTHVKDLSCLNRDLKKVLMVDCDKQATKLNESNTIVLKKWEGDPADRTLIDLIPLLQTIATSNVDDVRTVLDFYRKEDDIIEAFKRNQQRLREQEEQQAQIRQQQGSSSQWSGLFGRGLFGGGGNRARSVERK